MVDAVVEFRVLGPVEVRAAGQVVALGRPQQGLLMAALAVDAGRPVPVDTLADRLWDEPPAGARRTLYVLVSRLRRALAQPGEEVPLVRGSGGYLLNADPDQVDVLRFRMLAAQARQPGVTGAGRLALWREALALWRGEPLSGHTGQWAARTRSAWREQHLDAAVAWAQAELSGGDPGAVVGPLADLAAEHPLTESLGEMLMRALHAAGRPADALARYEALRQRLAGDLGTDPGPALQAVHQQILRGELAQPAVAAGSPPVPRQLPAAVTHFAGRSGELAALSGLLGRRAAGGGAVMVAAVGGTAGVGKTALAVHWAHQVRDRFPDGQLYVNLRGFDPAGTALEPSAVIRGFLQALGVAPQRIPGELDTLAAQYRSEMAQRRMLVVLDNARDTAQVRPLLPGAPGCLVVVTSRDTLSGLVAAEGAHPVVLDLLPATEARDLLARRLGEHRVAEEPEAVAEIVDRCARLPLALAVVAARAANHAWLPLGALAGELRDTGRRLEMLTTGDPGTDVRAVFSWSYEALLPGAARMFRHLGLHPGPDFAAPAAASLAALPLPQVRPLLAELARANLIVEHLPGRYLLHDLLRSYAADLVGSHETEQQRRGATRRVLDSYLHPACAAAGLLYLAREPIAVAPAAAGVTFDEVVDSGQALAWFTAEHAALLTAVDHAAGTGFDRHTWQLAWTLYDFLDRRGDWHHLLAVQRAAVAAAHRLGDLRAEARAHDNAANACTWLGRFDEARDYLRCAIDLARRAGDPAGQAHAEHNLSAAVGRQGNHLGALDHARRALRLYRAIGHRQGQADALNTIGWILALLGRHRQALTTCQRALALHQEEGDRLGQGNSWDSVGYAQHQLGQHTQAMASYRYALALYRDVGHRYGQAETLEHIGDTHQRLGNHRAAQGAWCHALNVLDELRHPDATGVRAKIDANSRLASSASRQTNREWRVRGSCSPEPPRRRP